MTSEVKTSLLSDRAILKCLQNKTIIINPFTPKNLSNCSYDVTLGPFYFRESSPEPGQTIYNPYSQQMTKKVWGDVLEAETSLSWSTRNQIKLENIRDDEKIIWLAPNETILAHTNEFVGGRISVNTMMKARSSLGRNFIAVCKCAGWGDIGYVNRWTMEITNNSRFYSIPLVVGRRIAQIVFFETEGTSASYEISGKYQENINMEELEKNWKPESILPKMYLDREIKN